MVPVRTSGSAPGAAVGLGAPAGDVDAPAVPPHERGPEALVADDAEAALGILLRGNSQSGGELAGERGCIVGDHDVQLARRAPEQQVAHGTADQLDILPAGGEIEQLPSARQLAHALEHHLAVLLQLVHRAVSSGPAGRRSQPVRTGIPAAARWALASAIVCRP